ncbi:MAG: hypothetical protein BGP06_17970 [Rhizobiales bacterium 65-9]|nr:glycosyltransferase family 4 protein [Hyphomicrobiales bacterium]OJY34730.1 MAG: hypothetical protein BGP06_17970 [Rhizobiales bacterium 65-9]
MRPVFFAIPGDDWPATGGYVYNRRMLDLAPAAGVPLRHLALPGSYPAPTDADLGETARRVAATPRNAVLMIDGLAFGAMPPDLIGALDRTIVALVHHPLGLENGISPERSRWLVANETAALGFAQAVIVTSETTARTLRDDFAVPQAKLVVAEPGVERAPRARGSGSDAIAMLAVGSLVPRKGYDMLIDALARMTDIRWSIAIAGADDRSPETTTALRAQIAARALGDRIALLGPVANDELARLYDGADLFVIASHYEGYGMAATEALARGLPLVSTTGGALAETVPDDAALKVAAGDADAFAFALRSMMTDPALRRRCADAAFASVATLPRWEDAAGRVARTLADVMTRDMR